MKFFLCLGLVFGHGPDPDFEKFPVSHRLTSSKEREAAVVFQNMQQNM